MKVSNRKTVGLALGSGGWRGLAHIGVIEELKKEGIHIDYIAGSSAGALIGGLYSYFGTTSEIEGIVNSLSYRSLYGILFDPARRSGIINGKKYTKFLEKYIGDTNIEDLKIKFTAVCADLFEGTAVGITRGKLSDAIRASSSIPIIFKPEMINGRYLVDGGSAMPVPTRMVKEMGADVVIGVDLYGNIFPFGMDFLRRERISGISVTRISYQMVLENFAKENLKTADVGISPKIQEGKFNIFKNFINNREITIEDGRRATCEAIPAIKKLLA